MSPQQPANAPLSMHWAFVVHFRTSTNIAQGQIEGRVEHVLSGQAAQFVSLDELLAFIAHILTQQQQQRR